jgi:hypothetical protein
MPTPIIYAVAPEQASATGVLLRAVRQSRDLWPVPDPIPTAELTTHSAADVSPRARAPAIPAERSSS